MDNIKKILEAIKKDRILLNSTAEGNNPQKIKNIIIDSFTPYFENIDNLKKYAIDLMAAETINLANISDNPDFMNIVEDNLSLYRKSKATNMKDCFQSFAFWHSDVLEANNDFWSIVAFDTDINNKDIRDVHYYSMRNIGEIIEYLIKPFLKVILHQIFVANNDKRKDEYINSLSIGNIIDIISRSNMLDNALCPKPWNLGLNQWRNIAFHGSFRVEGDVLKCRYGKNKQRTIILKKEETLDILYKTNKIYAALKLAYTIFFVDNIDNIKCYIDVSKIKNRIEGDLISFASALATQGFQIMDFEYDNEMAKLSIKDSLNIKNNDRCLHSTQFLYPVWIMTKSKNVKVIYIDYENMPILESAVEAKLCERVFNGELEIYDISKKMDLFYIQQRKKIPPLKDK